MDLVSAPFRPGSRTLPALVIGATLCVLAATIILSSLQTRDELRRQYIVREGSHLSDVTEALQLQMDDEPLADLLGSIDEPANQFTLLLKVSRLSGVIGARLFQPDGTFLEAFPAHVIESELPPSSLLSIQHGHPLSTFIPSTPLSAFFLPLDPQEQSADQQVPLLLVNVPLLGTTGNLAGIGQFIVEGTTLATEFTALDRQLTVQGGIAFLVAGTILVLVITLSFGRLRKAHTQLTERSNHLLKANQELALAAKTSAVGTVTAHLIHGLSNPLSGLHTFVTNRSQDTLPATDTDWQEAVESTQRMQNLIGDIVRVLAAETGSSSYSLSLAELLEVVTAKINPTLKTSGVSLLTSNSASGSLSDRNANLILLILENLLQNAIEASPNGSRVHLSIKPTPHGVSCSVQDQGPGLPDSTQSTLFTPCRSTKAGGNGIGLAISKQLAHHLGATLLLVNTSPKGSLFQLCLPAQLLTEDTPLPQSAVLK